ncbi:hypothetical protein BDV93DRAFT_405334, partial [Ceratobasidium sp. AG-I]
QFLIGLIGHSPDLYLDELQKALRERRGLVVSLPTIWRSLRISGFTMKKMSKRAAERSHQKRMEYFVLVGGTFIPCQLVFVDESPFDRRTTYR